MRRKNQKGFVLIAMSVAMLLMLATVGMAFDFGRIYIARNEAQLFTDAAALTAAKRVAAGQNADTAREAISKLPQRWNLGTQKFENVAVEFSPDRKSWGSSADDAEFVRVTAPRNDIDITFLRAVGGPDSLVVPAHSVAALHPVRLVE